MAEIDRMFGLLGVKPAGPHEQRKLLANWTRDQLLHLGKERMHSVAYGTLRTRVRRLGRKSSAPFLKRIAAAPGDRDPHRGLGRGEAAIDRARDPKALRSLEHDE